MARRHHRGAIAATDQPLPAGVRKPEPAPDARGRAVAQPARSAVCHQRSQLCRRGHDDAAPDGIGRRLSLRHRRRQHRHAGLRRRSLRRHRCGPEGTRAAAQAFPRDGRRQGRPNIVAASAAYHAEAAGGAAAPIPKTCSASPIRAAPPASPRASCVRTSRALTSTLIQLTEWEWPAGNPPPDLRAAQPCRRGGADLGAGRSGGSMVVLPGFDPVAVMQAIEKHRITSVLMVPTMVIALIDHPRFGEFDLSSLEVDLLRRLGVSGGAAQGRDRQARADLLPVLRPGRSADVGHGDAPRRARSERPGASVELRPADAVGARRAARRRHAPSRRRRARRDLRARSAADDAAISTSPRKPTRPSHGGWLHTGDVAHPRSPTAFCASSTARRT